MSKAGDTTCDLVGPTSPVDVVDEAAAQPARHVRPEASVYRLQGTSKDAQQLAQMSEAPVLRPTGRSVVATELLDPLAFTPAHPESAHDPVMADLVCARNPDEPDEPRVAAVERAAYRHLPLGRVIHPKRLDHLRPAFDRWREGRGYAEAWADHVRQALIPVLGEPLDVPQHQLFARARRGLQQDFEREILGRTLDSGDPVPLLPIEAEPYIDDGFARVEAGVAAQQTLQHLPPADQQLLLHYYDPCTDKRDLAAALNCRESAVRQRVSRLVRGLREQLREKPVTNCRPATGTR